MVKELRGKSTRRKNNRKTYRKTNKKTNKKTYKKTYKRKSYKRKSLRNRKKTGGVLTSLIKSVHDIYPRSTNCTSVLLQDGLKYVISLTNYPTRYGISLNKNWVADSSNSSNNIVHLRYSAFKLIEKEFETLTIYFNEKSGVQRNADVSGTSTGDHTVALLDAGTQGSLDGAGDADGSGTSTSVSIPWESIKYPNLSRNEVRTTTICLRRQLEIDQFFKNVAIFFKDRIDYDRIGHMIHWKKQFIGFIDSIYSKSISTPD
jgi:hypothetical protein